MEKAKEVADEVNHKVGDAAVRGIEIGEQAAKKVKDAASKSEVKKEQTKEKAQHLKDSLKK